MVKLKYALLNEKLISIDDIDEIRKGLKCGCICPACGEKLVAKKGSKTAHHFAHHSRSECAYGYETSLHLLAKEIFQDIKSILLPEVTLCRDVIIEEKKHIKIKNVLIEEYENNIKPDIIIEDIDNNKYYIEIFVTHSVDGKKLEKIKQEKINTIEIDLSKQDRLINYNDLKEILLGDNGFKKWIYNKKIEESKQQYFVPNYKLKQCINQNKYNQNWIFCLTHCKYGLNIQDGGENGIYCKRAKAVLAGDKLPNNKWCESCGCEMEIIYQDGYYYQCTGYPICSQTEKIIDDFADKEINKTKDNTTQTWDERLCPWCKSKLVFKFNSFLGCSKYPKCKYKRYPSPKFKNKYKYWN